MLASVAFSIQNLPVEYLSQQIDKGDSKRTPIVARVARLTGFRKQLRNSDTSYFIAINQNQGVGISWESNLALTLILYRVKD
jgi:hypothetical protein